MAGETYGLIVPPSGAAFVAGHAARRSQIEQLRQNAVILGKPRYLELGGLEREGHVTTVYDRLTGAFDVELCEEDFRGLTVTLLLWGRVADATGTWRVRLRNTDDGGNVAEMPGAQNNTTLVRQAAIACALPAGTTPKWCRLEILAGSALYPAYAFGRLKVAKL